VEQSLDITPRVLRAPVQPADRQGSVTAGLDDSGHVVSGVISGTAALAEEQDAGDDCQHEAGDSDVERPVEHGAVLVEADLVVLVHEPKVHAETNANADSYTTHTHTHTHMQMVSLINQTPNTIKLPGKVKRAVPLWSVGGVLISLLRPLSPQVDGPLSL